MELRQLRYFAAVVKEGNFTRAAEKCNVAQPSLSQQIKTLEDELGERLLHRRSRSVELTDAGRVVYERALRILSASVEIEDAFRNREELLAGKVTIGVIPTIGPFLLPGLMKAFHDEYPSIQLKVCEAQTEPLVGKVVNEEADLAVVSDIARAQKSKFSLHTQKLFVEPLLLAMPADHSLVHQAVVRVSDVDPEDVLVMSGGHCLRDQTLKICRSNHANGSVECEQLATLQALVSAGLGVAFIPEMSVAHSPVEGVVYRRFDESEPVRIISLMKRRGVALSRAASTFASHLKRHVAESNRHFMP